MRSRKKIILIAAGVTVLLIAIGGGVWWHQHQQDQEKKLASSQQAAETTDSSSSLNVGLGSAADLGQLDTSKKGQSAGGTSGSSSASGDVDPAQFAQYEKYKNEQNALFGDIQAGSGSAAAVGQKVTIYYRVWLTNGALVDQSPATANGQKQPFSFTLGSHQVIIGMEQGVAGMKPGGKRLIIVPSVAGYGSQGQGSIPPNAVLVFEVQLLNAQ